MANVVEIHGVDEIKAAMKKADKKLFWSTRRGLLTAGLFIQRESQKIVPVEFGNLKNSAGTRVLGHGWYSAVIVYYTASYAVYVHERTELAHKKGKSAKFLEKPIRENRLKILAIIAGEAERGMG